MAKIFFSYSHDDEALRDRLEKHLALLKRQGLVEVWYDRRIVAGSSFDNAISAELEQADIVLLLVSASFLASDYCYSREMMRALERQANGSTSVIPIILKPCDWHSAPFGALLAAPRDGKPVEMWASQDEAFADIAKRVREVVVALSPTRSGEAAPAQTRASVAAKGVQASGSAFVDQVRSSNLRLVKEFTDHDRDAYLHTTFDYVVRFFENSLKELEARNPGIQGSFRRIDADTFTATIYKNGAKAAECALVLGGIGGRGITYSGDARSRGNSFNEMLSVQVDDQNIFLRPTEPVLNFVFEA